MLLQPGLTMAWYGKTHAVVHRHGACINLQHTCVHYDCGQSNRAGIAIPTARVHAAAAPPHHSMIMQETRSFAQAWCLNESIASMHTLRCATCEIITSSPSLPTALLRAACGVNRCCYGVRLHAARSFTTWLHGPECGQCCRVGGVLPASCLLHLPSASGGVLPASCPLPGL